MCRVDHAGAANAWPRRGLRPFRPCARFARSSDSAVGSLKCSPVQSAARSPRCVPQRRPAWGHRCGPRHLGAGAVQTPRGGLRHVSILRICRSTGIALMVPTRARAGMPTARRPVCRAGLAHRAPSACKRPEPSSAAQALQCGGLFLYWLAAWHSMSGPLPMCSRRRMCGAGAARAAYCRSGSSRRRLKSPHACD